MLKELKITQFFDVLLYNVIQILWFSQAMLKIVYFHSLYTIKLYYQNFKTNVYSTQRTMEPRPYRAALSLQ